MWHDTRHVLICNVPTTYLCCASKLDVGMSNTLTVPELDPQAKMGILGWNATEDGASL